MDVPDVANVSVLLPGAAVTVVVDMVAAAASAVAATTRGCEGRRRNEATRGERTRAFVVSKLRSMLFVKQVKVTSVHIYKSLIPRGGFFLLPAWNGGRRVRGRAGGDDQGEAEQQATAMGIGRD